MNGHFVGAVQIQEDTPVYWFTKWCCKNKINEYWSVGSGTAMKRLRRVNNHSAGETVRVSVNNQRVPSSKTSRNQLLTLGNFLNVMLDNQKINTGSPRLIAFALTLC